MTIAETLKQEGRQEGLQQGRHEATAAWAIQLLNRFLGPLDADTRARINTLPLARLEQLREDAWNFRQSSDLAAWLEAESGLKA